MLLVPSQDCSPMKTEKRSNWTGNHIWKLIYKEKKNGNYKLILINYCSMICLLFTNGMAIYKYINEAHNSLRTGF